LLALGVCGGVCVCVGGVGEYMTGDCGGDSLWFVDGWGGMGGVGGGVVCMPSLAACESQW
jgi:hypothetical protein